jgi:mono/diheme cytochrome c family protein/glucose/arabinose dehydrogenase
MNKRLPFLVSICLFFAAFAVEHASAAAPEKLDIGPKSRVVLMGNGLGSRMLHFGHFETGMQLRHPDDQLFIRNMCDEGNTPSFRPHSGRAYQLGFPGAENFHAPYSDGNTSDGIGHFETEEEWLARLKPDVILAFFGFNESFLGNRGLANFRGELDAFVKHTVKQNYNGTKPAQLALVSPTAFQDITTLMSVPNGKRENKNLSAYTAIMEAVAAQNNILFINAFNESLKWYKNSDDVLTVDGALLNEAGYVKFSEFLIKQAFGDAPVRSEANRQIVQVAVEQKNWFWVNDFKIPNGVHVFGRRYKPYGPQNYPFEIQKIREMTDIRDQAIWSANAGKKLDVAALDAKTSVLPEVPTNYKPGGKNGALEFLKGDEATAKIVVPEGYKIEQWASEQEFPDLMNPVQMSFDNKGRLWVATMPTYPHYLPGDAMPNDKLIILEDTNNDGKADKQTTFADHLHLPMGFELAPEGVYLSQGINLVLLRDTDGDDHADVKEIVMSGFDDHDTHHAISAYCADPSGAMIMCEGVFLRTNVETAYGTVRGTDGGFYRFAPQRRHLERHAQLSIPNPWGVVFDDWGQHFFLHTSGPTCEWMLPGSVKPRYGEANPKSKDLLESAHRVRPTSGIEILSSSHFPDEVQGDLLINNNIGFLGTKQHVMEEEGTGYATHWRQDLTKSSDGNFRPVDLEVAPDGSLYIVDWQNPLIGHMQHNARDPNRDHTHGRIYRLTYPGRPLVKPAQVDGASIATLLDNLKLHEYRTRYRTRRELRGRNADEVLAATKTWIGGLDKTDPNLEHHLLEALFVSWGLDQVNEPLLRHLLNAKDHRARAAAVRVLRYSGHRIKDQAELLKTAAMDSHGRVKLEAIVAASWIGKQAGLAVLEAAIQTGSDPADAKAEVQHVKVNGTEISITHPAFAAGKVSEITLALPGRKGTLNISELEIYSGGKNIAKQANVSQSSNYNEQFPASLLVDGNKRNFAHTAEDKKGPWMKAEFASPVKIDEVKIWNRVSYETRIDGAEVTFKDGDKVLASVKIAISGGDSGSPFADDDWIQAPYKTALAHLNNQAAEHKEIKLVVPKHLAGSAAKLFVRGAEIYGREGHCGTCHQPDGMGLPSAGFPPLAGTKWTLEGKERLIKISLNGLMGPIEVKGQPYPGLVPMTGFGPILTDLELASVLTYVRNSFGNKAGEVTPEEVAKVREATKTKFGFYSPEEILQAHPHQ